MVQVRGYPKRARELATHYVREQCRVGAKLDVIAKAFGVHTSTVVKWTRERNDRGGAPERKEERRDDRAESFLPVRVRESKETPKRTYTLVSPTGWRLEGLDEEGVRALLVQAR